MELVGPVLDERTVSGGHLGVERRGIARALGAHGRVAERLSRVQEINRFCHAEHSKEPRSLLQPEPDITGRELA